MSPKGFIVGVFIATAMILGSLFFIFASGFIVGSGEETAFAVLALGLALILGGGAARTISAIVECRRCDACTRCIDAQVLDRQ